MDPEADLQRAVVRTIDGRSDFDGLHSRKHDHQVEFNAFDSRSAAVRISTSSPLSMPKASLARLPTRPIDGIFLSDFEQGKMVGSVFVMPA